MIIDSGAEEHVVVSMADLKFFCAVRVVTTWEFLAVVWYVGGAIIKWWS